MVVSSYYSAIAFSSGRAIKFWALNVLIIALARISKCGHSHCCLGVQGTQRFRRPSRCSTGHMSSAMPLTLVRGQSSLDFWHGVLSHLTKRLDHLCIAKNKSALSSRTSRETPDWRLTIHEPRTTSRCIYGCLAAGFKHVEHFLGTTDGTWSMCSCLR